jgi:hypothetical protein
MGEGKRRNQAREQYERLHPRDRLGDGPVQEKYHKMMTGIVTALDEVFNGKAGGPDRKTGFVLMVFPFGDDTGRCNYMSNGVSREDIMILMKEIVARFEGQPEMRGNA